MDEFMKQFDADKDGVIGLNELRAFLRHYNGDSMKMKRKTVPLASEALRSLLRLWL